MTEYYYKNLKVWQKAHELVKTIYTVTATFPKEEIFGLTSQIRRAAVSVPTNIVEGTTRNSNAEKLRFLNISQSSLAELDYELFLSMELGYFKSNDIFEKLKEVKRMLSSFYSSIQSR